MVFKTVAIKTKSQTTKRGNGVNTSTTQRKRLEDNIKVGRFCEKVAKNEYESDGWSVIKASYGYDFLAVKEISDGVNLIEHVEVKAGDANLSKLQVATMHKCRREGKSYRVFRVNSNYINEYINKESNAVLSCDGEKQMQDGDKFKKTSRGIFQIIKKFSGIMLHRNTLYDGTKIIFLGKRFVKKVLYFPNLGGRQ
jgi:hypothetical protein